MHVCQIIFCFAKFRKLNSKMDVSHVVTVGRKAGGSNVVDKLKKKKRRKRKLKEGKRSSASSTSATGSPESDGRLHKSRSAFSCPPAVTSQPTARKKDDAISEICQNFNDSLRWLPYIVTYSNALPPSNSNSRLCSPIAAKLVGSSNSVTESPEEEEERIAIYKMNRRKRYLAAQQALLSLYPDTPVYGGKSALDGVSAQELDGRQHSERRSQFSENIYSANLHVNATPSSSNLPHSFEASKFELSIKPVAGCQERNALTQKVL